jgi:hypothetical protein
MVKRSADLKGGAQLQAQLLKQKHSQEISDKQNRMKQEAEDRQKVI